MQHETAPAVRCTYTITETAEILGISPRKIQYRLAEYRDADPSGVPAVARPRTSAN